MKYENMLFISCIISLRFRDLSIEQQNKQTMIYIDISPKKYKNRGFNQIWHIFPLFESKTV